MKGKILVYFRQIHISCKNVILNNETILKSSLKGQYHTNNIMKLKRYKRGHKVIKSSSTYLMKEGGGI